MAERRMFSKKIIDSDAFLEMPLSTQALYFHLAMRADDEGFVGNPKRIRLMIGAGEDDMKLLIVKRFVLVFDSGVMVIKHWRIHNYINPDRFTPTTYVEEKSTLTLDEKKAYAEIPEGAVLQNVLQNGDNLSPQVSVDQISTDKDSVGKDKSAETGVSATKRFVKPTVEEIAAYCKERGNNIDAQQFYDYYESVGWKIGNHPMKDWKAAVRTWEQRRKGENPKTQPSQPVADKYRRDD